MNIEELGVAELQSKIPKFFNTKANGHFYVV